MRRKAIFGILAISATLLLTASAGADDLDPLEPAAPPQTEFAPGQLLIRFLPTVSPGRADEILAERGAAQIRSVAALDVRVLRLPPGLSVERAMEIFSRIPEVEFAEPNYILHAVGHLPEISGQWGLQQIQAAAAWSHLGGGGPQTLIAITDTGIDGSHTDLAGNLWANPGEIPGDGIDNDANGYIDDTWGWDFQNNDNDPFDDNLHGTLVSSVAAAVQDSTGVAGVCPWCQLVAVKVLGADGSGFLDTVANGIVYAADNGARVVNLSLGGAGGSQTLEDAVNHAWNKGALVVAAAGNDGADARLWPAAYPNSMAIASTNDQDFRSCFSNWGQDYISVSGPGESILGATPNQGYGTYSGTSLSTPHVSGLAGLLFSQAEADPAITRNNTDVRSLIEASANDLGPVGLDAYFGTGRINALRAVQNNTTATTPPAGMFTDDLSASGYAHARKLARDASGNLHLVWHSKLGAQYQVLYATSGDGGATWSDTEVVFSSSAETFHPALATDGSNLFVAFPTKQGSNKYRILFTSKAVNEGSWGPVGTAISGPFHAVRPDLYLDPTNERLHLVASSFDDKPDVYYTSSDDGGQSWDRVTAVNVATGNNQRSRYADIHASGTNVYIAGRTVEFTFFGLVPRYRAVTIRSMNGGSSWTDLTELEAYDGWFSGEYGMSLAGFGDQLYLSYENAGAIYYRSSADGANWTAATNLGGGAWPSITQADDGQAWTLWESGGNLVLRHWTGSGWEAAETLGAGNYPNLKLGTGGNAVEWANTHCSGAPFRLTSGSRSLGPVDGPPTATIVDPIDGSVVAGVVTIQVDATDAEDAPGSLSVEVSINGGTWQPAAYNSGTGYYELSWDTRAITDGPVTIDSGATDSANNTRNASQATVTVDNTAPSASITSPTQGTTVSATVDVAASASDAISGVAQVEFLVDGSSIGGDATAPYAVFWNTAGFPDGSHSLTATATDNAGHAATSDPVTVTVDNTPPTVAIRNPADASTVSGTVTVQIDATDILVTAGALTVEWNADGGAWQPATYNNGTGYYEAIWDTTAVANGSLSVYARATDNGGNTGNDSSNVTVDNVDEPPIVSLTNPAPGELVAGTVDISADATDDHGVTQVEFFVDGASIGVDTAGPYSLPWDSTAVLDGSRAVTATATDTMGLTASDSISVTVDNTSPTVSITSPSDGTTVSGTIDVTANATDATSGVTQVEFFLDGASIGVDSTSPYSVSWDTTTVTNGNHTLTATAADVAGNAAPSSPVTANVDNAVPSTTMHVGDLDGQGVKLGKGKWKATVWVLVHDSSHELVPGFTVTGTWAQNGWSAVASCTDGGPDDQDGLANGRCELDSGQFLSKRGKATFTVDDVTDTSLTYEPAKNHDPDGDSNGTSILISK